MARWLFWRVVQAVGVVVCVYTVSFGLLMMAPGEPFLGEKHPPKAVVEAVAERYGLSYLGKSAEERAAMGWREKAGAMGEAYVKYAGRLVRGDAPTISYESWTVNEVIGAGLPVSAALGAMALVMALWGGVAAGTVGAVWKGRWPDVALTVGTLFGVSLPTFVIGTGLLMVFAVWVPVLPAGGWGRVGQLVLPAGTLALFYMAYMARLTRVSVLDVLSADYVRTARAKGVGRWGVISKHVLGNATLPVLSYLGPAAATVLTGSFVVEKLFAVPGLGTHFVNACLNVDVPLVLGGVVVYTVVVVVFNLLVDVAYAVVDPRISLAA